MRFQEKNSGSLGNSTLDKSGKFQEDKIKEYLEKRERGELVSQKNELVCDFLMNKATLASNPDGWIKFGDVVMLINPHHEDKLAITYVGDQCGAFPSEGIAQLRNSFIIFSTDGSKGTRNYTFKHRKLFSLV